MSLGDHLRGLGARFDTAALRPPDTALAQPPHPMQAAAWQALRQWCQAGAGPGGCAWWQPGARPRVDTRLAQATLAGPDITALRALAHELALQLDGSHRLAACPGGAARLALRLRTKCDDALWWRQRRAHDPWDAGFVIDSAEARARVQQQWMPRRASLLVAEGGSPAAFEACVRALAARSAGFRHPVRLLGLVAGEPVLRFTVHAGPAITA
ncbi:MAG: hypothetical protein HY855_10915 [Burkholderiales bacterium]|nr:hypothetical protein [Burkholderiales bacterium]